MKIIDLQLNIDGLILNDDESIDDFINSLKVNSSYPIIYEVLYEECFMTNICKLSFEITCNVHDENAEDLGKDLAVWLRESWFNGEDVLDVEFIDYKVIL